LDVQAIRQVSSGSKKNMRGSTEKGRKCRERKEGSRAKDEEEL
jgi:hypothetical protein